MLVGSKVVVLVISALVLILSVINIYESVAVKFIPLRPSLTVVALA